MSYSNLLRLMPDSLTGRDKVLAHLGNSTVTAHSPAPLSCIWLSIYSNMTSLGIFKFGTVIAENIKQ